MPETDDDKIWAVYAKGVKPIPDEKKKRIVSPPAKKTPQKTTANNALPGKQKPAPALTKPTTLSLDRNVERRLRQGAVDIEARLDLHGMRQDEAHGALNDFIARQIKASRRCLLIITGKGRNGPGVLRANLAGWLAASLHAPHILALRPAAIQHGGTGAFYVLLKRKKNPA